MKVWVEIKLRDNAKEYTVIRAYAVLGTAKTKIEAQKICDEYVLETGVKAVVVTKCESVKVVDRSGIVRKIYCRIYAYRTQYLDTFIILPPGVIMSDLTPLT